MPESGNVPSSSAQSALRFLTTGRLTAAPSGARSAAAEPAATPVAASPDILCASIAAVVARAKVVCSSFSPFKCCRWARHRSSDCWWTVPMGATKCECDYFGGYHAQARPSRRQRSRQRPDRLPRCLRRQVNQTLRDNGNEDTEGSDREVYRLAEFDDGQPPRFRPRGPVWIAIALVLCWIVLLAIRR